MELELCALTPSDGDIPELVRMHNTPSISRYISISDNYFNYVTGTAGVVYYKIVAGGVPVGGLHCEIDGGIVYLSLCVGEEHRRRGIAEAALRRLLLTVPDGVNAVEAGIDETNTASLCLFRKLGFTEYGRDGGLITYRLTT